MKIKSSASYIGKFRDFCYCIVGAEDGMKLIESVKLVDELDKKSGILYNTQWSSVYNNTQKCLDICIGMDYEKTYHFKIE